MQAMSSSPSSVKASAGMVFSVSEYTGEPRPPVFFLGCAVVGFHDPDTRSMTEIPSSFQPTPNQLTPLPALRIPRAESYDSLSFGSMPRKAGASMGMLYV